MRRENLPERRAGNADVRSIECRRIGQVVSVRPEFDASGFPERDHLLEGEVETLEPWPADDAIGQALAVLRAADTPVGEVRLVLFNPELLALAQKVASDPRPGGRESPG